MKKTLFAFLLLTLVTGCSATPPNKTTLCTMQEGDLSIELEIVSQGDKIITHTSKTTADFSKGDLSKEEILKLIEDAKGEYEGLTGYTFEATYEEPLLVETLIADYSKISKEGLEEGYDQLANLLAAVKEQDFTCKE